MRGHTCVAQAAAHNPTDNTEMTVDCTGGFGNVCPTSGTELSGNYVQTSRRAMPCTMQTQNLRTITLRWSIPNGVMAKVWPPTQELKKSKPERQRNGLCITVSKIRTQQTQSQQSQSKSKTRTQLDSILPRPRRNPSHRHSRAHRHHRRPPGRGFRWSRRSAHPRNAC